MTGTPTAQDYYDEAYLQAVIEFVRCSGAALEGKLLEKFNEIFNKTIGDAIMNNGVKWQEPIASYGLRHICKIARRASRCADCSGMTEDDLDEAADKVIERARAVCTLAGGEIGILCPNV
jgi:hypothetical protein